jgi:hypothetical protein
MIKQNVFIINYNLLYEILDEIKENLSFDIIKHENEDNFTKDETFDKKNSLVITKSSNKFNLEKSLDDRNILNFQDYPILLTKLIELINIQLIKIKFNYQSRVIIKDYELNLNSKTFSKDNLVLKLTEKEIEIILYLIKSKNKHSVLDLQKNIWGYAPDMETHTVETHVYRLRKKIYNKFNENSFILSDLEGYFME